jgi:hypothetical protein
MGRVQLSNVTAGSAQACERFDLARHIIGLPATRGVDAASNVRTSRHVLVQFKSKN